MSRITDLSAVTTSSRHCAETDCKKCRARFRWTRRKSWRSRKSFNRRMRGRKSDADMTISIPLIALVVLIVYIAYRYLGLRVWHAIVCALLGFLLAATSAAPQIRAFVSAVVQWLQNSGKG